MDSLYLTSIIYMMLFVNTLGISREDETGKFSMFSEKSNFNLPLKRVTRNDELSKKINREFDKAILFFNIFNHIDNFMYEKTRDFVRKLNAIFDVDEKYRVAHSKASTYLKDINV